MEEAKAAPAPVEVSINDLLARIGSAIMIEEALRRKIAALEAENEELKKEKGDKECRTSSN